jgi:hypothetical protein
MFVNITNHPFTRWSKEQLDEAEKIGGSGTLIDLGHPTINPSWGKGDITKLAERWVEKVFKQVTKHRGEKVVIHVMGETGFTHAFVTQAKTFPNWELIYSSTGRDPNKIFTFVRFRRY